MASKLKIVIPVLLLLVLGGVYKFVIAKPAAEAKPKIAGTVYVLPKEFLVNLADGHLGKVSVGLVLAHGQAAAGGHGAEAATPPEGYGALSQEAVVRDIVTDTLTDQDAGTLGSHGGRERIKQKILKAISRHTDVRATQVLLMDVTVQ
jgi:flagellar basal body-associated protein FliL